MQGNLARAHDEILVSHMVDPVRLFETALAKRSRSEAGSLKVRLLLRYYGTVVTWFPPLAASGSHLCETAVTEKPSSSYQSMASPARLAVSVTCRKRQTSSYFRPSRIRSC